MPLSQLPFHVLLVGLLVGTTSFFTALAALNVRHTTRTVESELAWLEDSLGIEDPDDVTGYTRLKTGLGHLQSWLGLAFLLALLYAGVFTNIVQWLDQTIGDQLGAGIVFFVGFAFLLQLFSAPFDVVDTFVVEELYGFNNQTLGLWVRDAVLGMLVTALLTSVMVGALLWFILVIPTWWWAAGTVFFIGFAVTMQVIYPRAIAPLFNDFEPIEAGDLREAVESVFERAGFTCDELYSMDASRRSSHVNAYFVGFGRTKRVVLFDTLIERLELDEVQGVLAHELAHWKRHHVWKQLAGSTVRVGVMLVILWYLIEQPWLYTMFNLPNGTVYAGLFLGLLFVTPLLRLTAPIENRLSLAHEREADRFAVSVMEAGEPMIGALDRLASENLSNPFPHPAYAAFHYSHPPIPERIRMIREFADEHE